MRAGWFGRTASAVLSFVAAGLLLTVMLASGTTRFWALVAFVLATFGAIAAVGSTAAAHAFRRGRRVFGSLVLVSVPVVLLTLAYAVVAAQAESVSTTELVRNVVVVVVVVTVILAGSYLAGRHLPPTTTETEAS